MAVNSPIIMGDAQSYFLSESNDFDNTQDYLHTLSLEAKKTSSQPSVISPNKTSLTNNARLAPPKRWQTLCHDKLSEIKRIDEAQIINSWPFPTSKLRQKVIASDLGRATALCFPLASNDRIGIMCRLCMILVFVDDIIDHPSTTDREAYKSRLLSLMRGSILPSGKDQTETLLYDLWLEIRSLDYILAIQLLDSISIWFSSMAVSDSSACSSLGSYLSYRENDVGREMLSAFVRYAMGIHLSPSELLLIKPVEKNFVRQYSLVNDICSYNREIKTAGTTQIRSTVRILADETGLETVSVKRLLYAMVREYDERHDLMATEFEMRGCSEEVKRYMDGVRCMMSGNEEWHLTSPRYNEDVKF